MALIYASWVFYKRRLKVDNFILILIYIYLGLNLYYYISFEENDFFLSIYILMKMLYAYITIKCVGASFFSIFEKITYYLTVISLPLFAIQLINYEFLFGVVGIIQHNIPYLEYMNEIHSNIFVFTIDGDGAVYRNSGFAWEPKGFSNFLSLAIFINLVSNDFRINKRLLVFLVAMITTTSTTGFINTFVVLMPFFILNVKKKSYLMLVPILVLGGIIFFSSDIGYQKIKKEIDGRDRYIDLLEDTREFEARSLGRFPSFIVDFNDFLERPIFGYGFNRGQRTQSEYTKLVRVNGFSDLLATYGLLGFLFVVITYYKGFGGYLKLYKTKGNFLIIILFVGIYFASALTSHPFWMMFYFLPLINLQKLDLLTLYKIVFYEKSLDSRVRRFTKRSTSIQTN